MSATKLDRELAAWHANEPLYRSRGWLLLDVTGLQVDVGFLALVAAGARAVPVMTACIRLRYDNYDLWPPSLTFLDPLTRTPTVPLVRAPDRVGTEVRDALIDGHPLTGRPFLCLPGIREYHEHPQHSGDDWLLHRTTGAGRLAVVCERVWRRMARNVLGFQSTLIMLPPPLGPQAEFQLMQGDADALPVQPPPSTDTPQPGGPG